MDNANTCLVCGCSLKDDVRSREHIIPNALGGTLTTLQAFCNKCNSEIGKTVDAPAIAKLAWFSNFFDVPRDRGKHPNFVFSDVKTGHKYSLTPGAETARKQKNISVRGTDNGLEIAFSAPTREEAEAIYAKILKGVRRKRQVKESGLVGTPEKGSKFEFEMGWEFFSPSELRLAAKIALAYAREQGLTIDSADPTLRFFRRTGEHPQIGVPRTNVVTLEATESPRFGHRLFLHAKRGEAFCTVYIVLFEFIEYVVHLNCKPPGRDILTSYSLNLIDEIAKSEPFTWIVENQEQGEVFATQISSARVTEKFSAVTFWITHRKELFIRRALQRSAQKFFDLIGTGSSETEAEQGAQEAAQSYLAKYFPDEKLSVNMNFSRVSAGNAERDH